MITCPPPHPLPPLVVLLDSGNSHLKSHYPNKSTSVQTGVILHNRGMSAGFYAFIASVVWIWCRGNVCICFSVYVFLLYRPLNLSLTRQSHTKAVKKTGGSFPFRNSSLFLFNSLVINNGKLEMLISIFTKLFPLVLPSTGVAAVQSFWRHLWPETSLHRADIQPSSPTTNLLLGTLISASLHWWGNGKLYSAQHHLPRYHPTSFLPPLPLTSLPSQPWDRRSLVA